jgi:hypothetical protein
VTAKARKVPPLVSRKKAAEILGCYSSYISRLAERGVMPDSVPVEGGADVYVRAEVEQLARDRKKKKAKRGSD